MLFLSTLSLRRATISCQYLSSDFWNFYPRSPCGERRVTVLGIQHRVGISIHALLAESDCYSLRHSTQSRHFYPRSPCGERLFANFEGFYWWVISIHALLAESDSALVFMICLPRDFYPRSPCGERLYDTYAKVLPVNISIHALLAESDFRGWTLNINGPIFLSTLSLRRATWIDGLRA